MIGLILCIGVTIAFMLVPILGRHGARREMKAFMRMFPDKCPICSFHRFGFLHGYETSLRPRPHANCPEGYEK